MAVSGALALLGDAWRWPLLRVEGWVETGPVNAIFTDSWPLLAGLWKLAGAPAEPAAFLSAGLLLLFLLQGAAAGLALRLLGLRGAGALAAGALVLALWPAFLFRVPVHLALSAHGLVILAMGMALAPMPERSGPRMAGWGALLCVAALTHAYLLAMALLGFLFALAAAARGRVLAQGLAVLGALAAVMLAAGYAEAPATGAGGYGHFRLNLAAPIAAAGGSLLPDLAALPEGHDDGYAYLSAGGALLLVLALGLALAGRGEPPPTVLGRPRAALLAGLGVLVLLAFATAGRFDWGTRSLAELALPAPFEVLGSKLRGAGRMVWPLAYALVLLALVRLAAAFPGRAGAALLAGLAGLMAVELSPLRAGTIPAPGPWSSDPVLAREIARAGRLASIPPWGCDPDHVTALDKEMQLLAARSGTRLVNSFAAARRAGGCAGLPYELTGVPAPGALVVLKHGAAGFGPAMRAGLIPEACRAHRGLALCRADWPEDGALPLPGAPGLAAPASLAFSDPAVVRAHLGEGFSGAEPWGVWSTGSRSRLAVPLDPSAGARSVALRLRGFVPPARPETAARLGWRFAVPGELSTDREARLDFTRAEPEAVAVFPVPDGAVWLELDIYPDFPVSPAEIGTGTDRRSLGVGLVELTIRTEDGPIER